MALMLVILFVISLLFPSATSTLDNVEYQALLDFYKSTVGTEWTMSTNWMQGDPCFHQWFGVICDDANTTVNALYFSSNNLQGQLPSSIGTFQNLIAMDVNGNHISGQIPTSFSTLTKLYALGMTFNNFTGPLFDPSKMPNLQFLHLDFNKFSGEIPPGYFQLPKLDYFGLYGNNLSGRIPDLSAMEEVQFIFLAHNSLEGVFPNIDNLQKLQVINIEGNKFTGSLPELTNLPNLKELQLGGNLFQCPLPTNYQDLLGLIFFMGSNNGFSGPIPNSYGDLQQIRFLSMDHNSLSGTIPSFFKDWSPYRINLANNPFSCPIPSWAEYTGATCKQNMSQKNKGIPTYKHNSNNNNDDDLVEVAIFGMAKCPDMKAIEGIFNEIITQHPDLLEIMDLKVEFIGTVQESEPTGIYSMHGQTEALGTLFELCVKEKYSQGNWKRTFQFIECLNENQSKIPENILSCAKQMSIDYDQLLECALSNQAKQWLQDSAKLAGEYNAVWSPTVFINKQRYCLLHAAPCPASTPEDFVRDICKTYKGHKKPISCR